MIYNLFRRRFAKISMTGDSIVKKIFLAKEKRA